MRFEVDVQPLASCPTRLLEGGGHECRPYSSMTRGLEHHRVLEPGMNQAVPEDVDEPNKLPVVPRDDPPEAVPMDLFDPVPLGLIEKRVSRTLLRAVRSVQRC
jgi:hypothetical protein